MRARLLHASVYVLDAVTLIPEGAAVGARSRHPTAVLALILVRWDGAALARAVGGRRG